MDAVIDMFELDRVESEVKVTEAVHRMVTRARPGIAARLSPNNAKAFMDPLVLAYFQGAADPGVTLDQLMFGYMDPPARPHEIPIRTDVNGSAELPGIGILRTNHASAELSLDDRLHLTIDGHDVSAQREEQPRVRFENEPLLDSWVAPPLRFILSDGAAREVSSPQGSFASDLRRAVDMLERVQPDFAKVLNRTTRRVVVFDRPDMNSLAAPRAHGSVFLNVAHGCGAIYHLEDLLHQCGHVAFQAMTMYPETILAVDPDEELGDPDTGSERRSAYVAMHAVVTERWMAQGLLSCLETEDLSVVERAEARGRLAYVLARYALDLVELVNANVTTQRGTELLAQLLTDLRRVHTLAQRHTRGLDMSGQPYNFHNGEFLARNPALLSADR